MKKIILLMLTMMLTVSCDKDECEQDALSERIEARTSSEQEYLLLL